MNKVREKMINEIVKNEIKSDFRYTLILRTIEFELSHEEVMNKTVRQILREHLQNLNDAELETIWFKYV